MSIFSDNLKYLRERAGMSRNDLAKAANVANASIGFYETGKREPQASTIIALAAALNVSTDTLLGVESNAYARAIEKLDRMKKTGVNFDYITSENLALYFGDTMHDDHHHPFQTKDFTALRIPPTALAFDNSGLAKANFWHIIKNDCLISGLSVAEQDAAGKQADALNFLMYFIFCYNLQSGVTESEHMRIFLGYNDDTMPLEILSTPTPVKEKPQHRRIGGMKASGIAKEMDFMESITNGDVLKYALQSAKMRGMNDSTESAHEKSAKADDSDQGAKKD